MGANGVFYSRVSFQITSIEVGTICKQHAHNFLFARFGCEHQRSHTILIRSISISPSRKEYTDGANSSAGTGCHQGCFTLMIAGINIGPLVKEKTNNSLIFVTGKHERKTSIFITSMNVCTMFNKNTNAIQCSYRACKHQRRTPVVVGAIDIDPKFNH